ncbi:MAG: hypothetical protein JWM74_856, partial [Myxococcaceae bacterium]|nr:hypothetical protein [Myxococcaceae bacterium]
TRKVTTAGEASTALEVPTLVDPNAPPATPPPPTSDTSKHDHVEPPPEQASGGGTRTLGFIVGGAGIAVLGVGTVFGIMALGQKSDADAACGGSGTVCPDPAKTSDATAKLDDARTSALISTIGIGVGVVAVGVGAYLIFTGGAKPASITAQAKGLQLVPAVGARSQGLLLSGAF